MPENWRERIKAGMLANRLYAHFNGEVELSSTQIKSAEILFKRIEPELNRTELTGKDGGAIETKTALSDTDNEILALHRQKVINDYLKSTKGKTE